MSLGTAKLEQPEETIAKEPRGCRALWLLKLGSSASGRKLGDIRTSQTKPTYVLSTLVLRTVLQLWCRV